jgi:hypothetical protein
MACRDRESALGVEIECCRSLKHFFSAGSGGISSFSHLNLLFPTLVEKKWQVKQSRQFFQLRQRLTNNSSKTHELNFIVIIFQLDIRNS